MGDLVYSMGVSLDGFVEDANGSFDWSEPDEDVHRLANQQARSASAFVYGRRMFEIMDDYWMQAAGRKDIRRSKQSSPRPMRPLRATWFQTP